MTIRKGWCPTMTRPMETGDGLLVRLHIKDFTLNPKIALGIAKAAEKYGNGHIDLTSRGNLQIRGVTPLGYNDLLQYLYDLGLTNEERPCRSRDNGPALLGAQNGSIVLGLPFGRMDANMLTWLSKAAQAYNTNLILTAKRAVIIPDVPATILQEAQLNGFMIDDNDPRRLIQACPGAPACSSAQGDTRNLSKKVAHLPLSKKTIHISGCAKSCACASKTDIAITATPEGYNLGFNSKAGVSPTYTALTQHSLLQILSS